MSEAIKFGTIGCGRMIEAVHGPNMAAIPDAEISVWCDLDEDKAKQRHAQYGGAYTTTDYRRVLADPAIDGVLICIGPKAHPKLVQDAAKAGKHIFVEKPLADDVTAAVQTARVVEGAGVKFIHGTCSRVSPIIRMAARMIPSPTLLSYAHSASTVTHQPVHHLDLAINLWHRQSLVSVYASGGHLWGNETDKDLAADAYSSVLTFADGSVHTYLHHSDTYNPRQGKYGCELHGKDWNLYIPQRFMECHFTQGGQTVRSWTFEGSQTDRGPHGYMGHYDELAELVDCIRNDGIPTMTVRQAAYVCAVENAILTSVATKQVVDFAEYLRRYDAEFVMEAPA